eukprot:gene10222-13752_t
MSNNKRSVVLVLYRSLLRVCRSLDGKQNSKALIYRNSVLDPIITDGDGESSIKEVDNNKQLEVAAIVKNDSNICQVYRDMLIYEILAGKSMYIPSKKSPSLTDIAKKHFRIKSILIQNNEVVEFSNRIDTAFWAYRRLRCVEICNSSPQAGVSNDSDNSVILNELRSNISFTMPSISLSKKIATGTILLSHPLVQGPLRRAAVLILRHSDKECIGLVINKATDHNVSTGVKNLPSELLARIGKYPVRFGGMVKRLQFIHNISNCGGVALPKTKKPLYFGCSPEKIVSMFEKHPNPITINNFHVYVGCCVWNNMTLQKETDAGLWIPVNTEPDVILKLANGIPDSDDEDFETEQHLAKEKLRNTNDEVNSNFELLQPSEEEEKKINSSSKNFPKKHRNGKISYQLDVWKLLFDGLEEPYKSFSLIPDWLDSSNTGKETANALAHCDGVSTAELPLQKESWTSTYFSDVLLNERYYHHPIE